MVSVLDKEANLICVLRFFALVADMLSWVVYWPDKAM